VDTNYLCFLRLLLLSSLAWGKPYRRVGRDRGVGRGLGVTLGVAVGVTVGVAVGVDEGVGVAVGVGEGPCAVVIRYSTLWFSLYSTT
jgi:hypothetical protein